MAPKTLCKKDLEAAFCLEREKEARTCLEAAFVKQAHCFHLDAGVFGFLFVFLESLANHLSPKPMVMLLTNSLGNAIACFFFFLKLCIHLSST